MRPSLEWGQPIHGTTPVVAGTEAQATEARRPIASGACVELCAVTKTFGPVRALVGVSARFESGRLSLVVGPNGSGKSTLLALVGAHAKPTSGEVVYGTLGRSRSEVRSTLGWVGHKSLCYAELTGRENVELSARLHGLDPEEAMARAVERFDLGSFAERPVRTYSRGQRQRVALARALVHSPRLLLLDEPSAGLDSASTARLLDVIRQEVERGAVVVVVTHDPSLTTAIGGNRVELDRGRRV